jgi:L-Ala-D/L-Glu epimerase / N-acetyl-D-glutamate racemase
MRMSHNITRKDFVKRMACFTVAGGFLPRVSHSMTQARERALVPVRSTVVRNVEVFPYSIKEKVVVKTALGVELAENFLVRLRTADGVVGLGEGSPFSPITAETQQSAVVMAKQLGETLRGRDPFTIARIVADMDAFAPGNPSSKAALEMAVWDLCGKITGQPVCCLLGRYRDTFETDKTMFLESPDAMARTAREIVGQGFKILKVKVGESPDEDTARIRAIREAVGPNIRLRVDANQGWTPAEAVKCLRQIGKYEIEFAEQPGVSWDWAGMKFIRDNVPMPVMADESVHVEHDALDGIRENAIDLINIKLMKSGGILHAMRIADVAAAADLKCMVGCMSESKLGVTAGAHLVCAQKSIVYADLDADLFHSEEPTVGGMEIKDGTVTLPQEPGLGVDLDPAFIARLRAV